MSFDYIRRYYNVPAKRGGRVAWDTSKGTREGTITSATNYVYVRFDDCKFGGAPAPARGRAAVSARAHPMTAPRLGQRSDLHGRVDTPVWVETQPNIWVAGKTLAEPYHLGYADVWRVRVEIASREHDYPLPRVQRRRSK